MAIQSGSPAAEVSDIGTNDEDVVLSANSAGDELADEQSAMNILLGVLGISDPAAVTMIDLASGANLTIDADGSYSHDPSSTTNIDNMPIGPLADSLADTVSDGPAADILAELMDARNDISAAAYEETSTVVNAAPGVLANDSVGLIDPVQGSAVLGNAADAAIMIAPSLDATLTVSADGSYSSHPSSMANIGSVPLETLADIFAATDGHGPSAIGTAEPVEARSSSNAAVDQEVPLMANAGGAGHVIMPMATSDAAGGPQHAGALDNANTVIPAGWAGGTASGAGAVSAAIGMANLEHGTEGPVPGTI